MAIAHLAKYEALAALYEQYREPVRQAMGGTANFVRGHGNEEAEIVFVGEAPGLDEDRQGKPFVGRAGKLLTQWIGKLGLEREQVYITNVVKCHPMKDPSKPDSRGNDRPPKPSEIELCKPILVEELRILQPKVLVALGSPAARTLLSTKKTISELRGNFFTLPETGTALFPMFHPAALFHNPPLAPLVEQDLRKLREWLSKAK